MAEGAFVSFFAGAKAGKFPTVPQITSQLTSPAFVGTVDEFVAAQGEKNIAAVQRMMRNRVKKCLTCHKPNAFTLVTCNGCGSSLEAVEISYSPNVFMGFVFGVQRCPFPLTVSVRKQTEDLLVMDDLLAISPLHFNVIPTSVYIPDWRYLLRRPKEGAQLIQKLRVACEAAASDGHLANKEWVGKIASGPSGDDPIRVEHLLCGFNYPPSQYQLHLQFFAPVLLPFQHSQFLRGIHFTCKRFFPYDYVAACLAAALQADTLLPPSLLADETDIEVIIDYFSAHHGVHYCSFHQQFLSNFAASSRRFSSWKSDDFDGIIVSGGGEGDVFYADGRVADGDSKLLVERDKLKLQNYGRPYTSDGRPQGTYYSFPKAVADVESW
jgi:hypothetical protein